MAEMYEIIDALLAERGISCAQMSSDLGMSRSLMTELRKGRAKSIKLETAQKIAEYFGVSLDYLTGETAKKRLPIMASVNLKMMVSCSLCHAVVKRKLPKKCMRKLDVLPLSLRSSMMERIIKQRVHIGHMKKEGFYVLQALREKD